MQTAAHEGGRGREKAEDETGRRWRGMEGCQPRAWVSGRQTDRETEGRGKSDFLFTIFFFFSCTDKTCQGQLNHVPAVAVSSSSSLSYPPLPQAAVIIMFPVGYLKMGTEDDNEKYGARGKFLQTLRFE